MTHNTREEWESVTWNVLSSVQIGRMSLADAQDKLDAVLHHQLQKAREEEREMCIQAIKNPLTNWECTASLENGDAHNHKTITVCRAVASIKALDHSELDQDNK